MRNPKQELREKIKPEFVEFFDRGIQTRKFNPDYDQDFIDRNFGIKDERSDEQEKQLFYFYAGYNAEELSQNLRAAGICFQK